MCDGFPDVKKFQSTLPCGERREITEDQAKREKNFNPRSPAGSDDKFTLARMQERMCISIHAPLRGATDPHNDLDA